MGSGAASARQPMALAPAGAWTAARRRLFLIFLADPHSPGRCLVHGGIPRRLFSIFLSRGPPPSQARKFGGIPGRLFSIFLILHSQITRVTSLDSDAIRASTESELFRTFSARRIGHGCFPKRFLTRSRGAAEKVWSPPRLRVSACKTLV